MLEDRDYQEIAHMFKVIVESDIGPKLNKLAEGQQVLLETLAPKNRVGCISKIPRCRSHHEFSDTP